MKILLFITYAISLIMGSIAFYKSVAEMEIAKEYRNTKDFLLWLCFAIGIYEGLAFSIIGICFSLGMR